MSYYPPPPPPAGRPQKPPPGRAWYVVGVALMVGAVLVFVAGLLIALMPLFQEDAVFDADGESHLVELPAGEGRAVFVRENESASCTATDADGAQVAFEMPRGDMSVNGWVAVRTFDTGAGDVEFVCETQPAGSQVRIGETPSGAQLVTGILVAVLLPLALGITGLVLVIVTAVRRSRRPPTPMPPR